jgi:ABC-type polar amino acid transport system ATPase subunit
MVFQHFNLFEHMSALENVCEAPVRVFGVARPEAEREARALLARVGLADHAHKRPFELSGGQQQRVGIARALAIRPNLLLFDEPTSALDPELVKEVLQVIREISHEGKTMIIVTHELSFAAEISDRIVFMDDGRVVETGNARELLAHPKTDRLKLFLSHLQRDGADQSDV